MKKIVFIVMCLVFNDLTAQSDAYPGLLVSAAGSEGCDIGNDRYGNIYIVGNGGVYDNDGNFLQSLYEVRILLNILLRGKYCGQDEWVD